jgi:ABC-type Fe3+ transport system substrate-binding protein
MVQLRVDAGEPLGWTNPERLGRVPANVILATAPHPNAARLFADWLMAEEGQTLIGKENLGFPARPGVPCYMAQFYPAGVRFQINRPDEVARQKKSLVEMYQRLFFNERKT